MDPADSKLAPAISTDGNEELDSPDFEVYILDENEAVAVQDNKYVQTVSDDCYLSLLQPNPHA